MNSRKFKLVPEAVAQRCSVKKMFLEISENLQETIKKETLTQALSCEFCEISMNTFSCRTPPAAASIVFNIFVLFNCVYCSLAWMFHNTKLHNRENSSYERCLLVAYFDASSSDKALLEKDNLYQYITRTYKI